MQTSIYKNNLTLVFSMAFLLALWEETLKACFTLLVQPDFLIKVCIQWQEACLDFLLLFVQRSSWELSAAHTNRPLFFSSRW